jgi:hypothetical protein
VAWWSGKEGAAGAFYARSGDGARTFDAPVALGVGARSRPAHVQLALAVERSRSGRCGGYGTVVPLVLETRVPATRA